MLLIMIVISKPLNKENEMMKQNYLWKALLTTTLLTSGAANANEYFGACDPCEMDSCFGGFEIGVDFLYWKTCKDDLNYAVVRANVPATIATTETAAADAYTTGSQSHINLDWKPGFRIYTSIDDVIGNWSLYGSYTWFSTANNSKLEITPPSEEIDVTAPPPITFQLEQLVTFADPAFNINFLGDPSAVKAKYDLSFQSFDVLFAGNYALKQCHYFKPYFGVTGLFINQEFKIDTDTINPILTSEGKWTDKYDGYGLKVGSEYNLALCDGFSLFGNGAGLITVGNHTASFEQEISGEIEIAVPSAKLSYEECVFLPGYQISAGFQFDGTVCDFEYAIKIAYEFQNYFNTPNLPLFVNEDSLFLSSSTTNSNLGFHGLSAGFNVKF